MLYQGLVAGDIPFGCRRRHFLYALAHCEWVAGQDANGAGSGGLYGSARIVRLFETGVEVGEELEEIFYQVSFWYSQDMEVR